MIINWLRDAEKLEIKGRGILFTGPSPLTVNKNNASEWQLLLLRPWVISHPEAMNTLWRCKAIESFCISTIHEGQPIGILVEPWPEMEFK